MIFKKTREEILDGLLGDISRKVPQINHYAAGGVFRLFLEITASLLKKLYDLLDELQANRFLQTARGQYLDWKAEELGLSRRPALKAQAYAVFQRDKASDNLRIAPGKIIASLPDSRGRSYRYAVIEEAVLAENEKQKAVLVEAEEAGAAYNGVRPLQAVNPIGGIDRIFCQSGWIFLPGAEEESDESLRQRCQAQWKGLGGANGDAYASWAKGVEGIGSVVVVETARGLGTVDVVCMAEGNVQPSPELITRVQACIEERRPIGADCLVRPPQEIYIDVGVRAVFSPGFGPQKQAVEEAVRRYFETMEIGSDYEPSALIAAVIAVDGVKSVAVDMNSRRLSRLQIARLGNISIEVSQSGEA